MDSIQGINVNITG